MKKPGEQFRESTPGDQGYIYNLRDSNAKSEVQKFAKDFQPYVERYGIHAFDHWCVDKGFYTRAEFKKDSNGGDKLINSAIAGEKTDNGTRILPAYYQNLSLYKAWEYLIKGSAPPLIADDDFRDVGERDLAPDLPF